MRSKQPLVKPMRSPCAAPGLGPLAQLVGLHDLGLDAQQVAMRAAPAPPRAHAPPPCRPCRRRCRRRRWRAPPRRARATPAARAAATVADDGVARARHVEHLARRRRKRVRRALGIDQQHAVLAEGDQHGADIEAPRETARALGLLAGTHLGGRRGDELATVRRDHVGAAVAPEFGLRIDDDARRPAACAAAISSAARPSTNIPLA